MYENIKNFHTYFLLNVTFNLDDMYAATTCWFVEAHAKLLLHKINI